MRKILVILIFFLAAGFITLGFGEIETTAKTLQNADWRFLSIAVFLQLGFLIVETAVYRALYRLMDIEENLRHLSLVIVAANFINVVAPSGGMSGIAILVDDARRRNRPSGRTAAAAALHLFLDYAAFLCVLALGIIILFRRNNLDAGEISASALMATLCLAIGILIYIGSHSGERLGKILAWLAQFINALLRPFLRRDYLRTTRAHEFACEIAEGLSILRTNQRGLLKPFAYALLGKGLQTLLLMFVFLGFGVDFSAGTIIAGFAISYLFLIVSPTPSGIGVVEGILPLVLVSLRVPWEQAVVVTLTYRGLTFWLTLLSGALAFRVLQRE